MLADFKYIFTWPLVQDSACAYVYTYAQVCILSQRQWRQLSTYWVQSRGLAICHALGMAFIGRTKRKGIFLPAEIQWGSCVVESYVHIHTRIRKGFIWFLRGHSYFDRTVLSERALKDENHAQESSVAFCAYLACGFVCSKSGSPVASPADGELPSVRLKE